MSLSPCTGISHGSARCDAAWDVLSTPHLIRRLTFRWLTAFTDRAMATMASVAKDHEGTRFTGVNVPEVLSKMAVCSTVWVSH